MFAGLWGVVAPMVSDPKRLVCVVEDTWGFSSRFFFFSCSYRVNDRKRRVASIVLLAWALFSFTGLGFCCVYWLAMPDLSFSWLLQCFNFKRGRFRIIFLALDFLIILSVRIIELWIVRLFWDRLKNFHMDWLSIMFLILFILVTKISQSRRSTNWRSLSHLI